MPNIYVVTHGEKFKGANPCMTDQGFNEIKNLKGLLPVNPSIVVIGTGARFCDVALALDLVTDSADIRLTSQFRMRFTPVVGGPESLEGEFVLLADGTKVPRDQFTGTEDGKASMTELVCSLPDNAVICAGRVAMILLGKEDAKSAAVYQIITKFVNEDLTEAVMVEVRELVTTGVSEPGTV